MSWDNLNPILVYTLIGAVVFFSFMAWFANGDSDDCDSDKKPKSH